MTQDAQPIVSLDVRPNLAAGEEPFDLIMQTAATVPPDGSLELTAPFEPVPLYRALSRLGFGYRTETRADDEVVVRFRQLGITGASLVADVHERHPGTAPVLADLGVDLCCGGGKPLDVVARAHGLEPAALLTSLQRAAMNGDASGVQ
jgi:hypothetical protein